MQKQPLDHKAQRVYHQNSPDWKQSTTRSVSSRDYFGDTSTRGAGVATQLHPVAACYRSFGGESVFYFPLTCFRKRIQFRLTFKLNCVGVLYK